MKTFFFPSQRVSEVSISCAVAAWIAWALVFRASAQGPIQEGVERIETLQVLSVELELTDLPIPESFFGPGSEPFDWRPPLPVPPKRTSAGHLSLGWTGEPNFEQGSAHAVKAIDLRLLGPAPITVRYLDGHEESWTFHVDLSNSAPQPWGRLTLDPKPCEFAGRMSVQLPIQPRIVFTRTSDGLQQIWYPTTLSSRGWELTFTQAHWVAVPDAPPPSASRRALPQSDPLGFRVLWGHRSISCNDDCSGETNTRIQRVLVASGPRMTLILAPSLATTNSLDSDADSIPDFLDNAPSLSNLNQEDSDDDAIGDIADNCPRRPNFCQEDANRNGIGDACESVPSPRIEVRSGQIVLGTEEARLRPVVIRKKDDLADARWLPFATLGAGTERLSFPMDQPRGFYATADETACICTNVSVVEVSQPQPARTKIWLGNTNWIHVKLSVRAQIFCQTDLTRTPCSGVVRIGINKTDDPKWVRNDLYPIHGSCLKSPRVLDLPFGYYDVVTNGNTYKGIWHIQIAAGCDTNSLRTFRSFTVAVDFSKRAQGSQIRDFIDYEKSDLDGDGASGEEEKKRGTLDDPEDLNENGIPDLDEDPDKDGLSNREEHRLGTETNNPDTDGDGVTDKQDLYPRDPTRWK